MHIKFISRGKGSARSAEEYLLQEHDHNGEIRADVQVLRGNPSHVSQLADSLDFKHRYTSGVIAWHVDDNPTDNQIDQVLDDFERVAFAGLEPNQYSYYAVLHEESNGAKHVHVIAPRVELSSGKSLNIAPPNWQKTYDVLVDKYNTKHNWASPKDLHRRKLVNNQISIHSNMSHTKAKVEINKAVMELVARGTIQNENDVTKYLNSIDGVTIKPRRSNKNLSIELEGIKKPIRLEGLAYAKGFDVRELRQELRTEQEQRAGATKADRTREHERISNVFENIITDRAKFNQGRYIRDAKEYQPKQQDPKREHRELQQRDSTELSEHGSRANEDKNQTMDNPNSHGVSHSHSPSVGNMGNYQVPHAPTPTNSRARSNEKASRSIQSNKKDIQVTNRNVSETEPLGNQQRNVDNRTGEIDHDAIRERIKSNLADTRADVQGRITESNDSLREKYKASKHSVHKTDERSIESDRTAEQHDNKAERSTTRVREHINELADKFERGTSSKLRELIYKAEGQVGELATAVKQFREKAIAKVKEIAKEAQKTISHGFGMSR
jgi:hypothetical protein